MSGEQERLFVASGDGGDRRKKRKGSRRSSGSGSGVLEGKVKVHDPFELVRWLALSQPDIQVGDLLTTSGLGGVFPKGYPVAKITRLTPLEGEAFMHAEAQTMAKIERTQNILLVWSKQQPIPLVPAEPMGPEKPATLDQLPPNAR